MTDSRARTPRISVSSPDVLPVAVPHLLGFVPGRSLVVVGLSADRQVVLALRFDLPPDGFDDWPALLAHWRWSFTALGRAGALSAVLLVYPAGEDGAWPILLGLPHGPLVHEAADLVRDAGVAVTDLLCVVGDRLRSYLCDDSACCPPEGRRTTEAERVRIEAAFVVQGSAPLRSRAELEASLDARADDDPFLVSVRRAREGVVVRLPAGVVARVDAFVRDVERWGRRPGSTSLIVRLVVLAGVLTADIPSRDLLLKRLTSHPDRDLLGAARQVLAETVRCARGGAAAQPAAALAVCAWSAGDGAAARVAVVRSLEADESCSLALLVEQALDAGLPPRQWSELIRGISDAEILGEDPAAQARRIPPAVGLE